MRLYGAFTKAEVQSDGTVRVEGIASSEAIDDQGETIRAAAMRDAIPDYMRFPALREMHQLSAAGTTLEATVDEDGMTRIVGHVVDPIAVSKIKTNTYRGFSIGGRVTARDPADRTIITGLQLNEISLVDRPANPNAIFDCWKAGLSNIEGSRDMPGLATLGDLPAGEKLVTLSIEPIQVWTCGNPSHAHAAKAEAAKCIEKRSAAGDTESAAVKEPGEDAPGAVEPPVDGGAEVGEPPTEKGAPAAQEGSQAAIAAGLEAIERGKAVLEPPAATAEETDDIPVVAEAAEGEAASKADGGETPRIVKSLDDVGDVAQVIMFLDGLADQLSKSADETHPAVAAVGTFVRNLVAEQTGEIVSGTELDDDAMIQMSAVAETLRKAGLPELAATLDKAVAAKHSAKSQMLLDTAHACATKCMKTDGCSATKKEGCAKACDAMEAAGAKGWSTAKASDSAPWLDSLAKSGGHQALLDTAHDCLKSMTAAASCAGSEKASKEIMGKVAEAHDHLCAAGATCDGAEKTAAAAPAPAPAAVDDDALAKALAERDTERSTTAALTKVLADLTPMVVGLTERVEKIAGEVHAIHETPIPPMAIARTATNGLSKNADNGGATGTPVLSQETIAAALAKMTPEDRALTEIKASYASGPIVVKSVASTAQHRALTP